MPRPKYNYTIADHEKAMNDVLFQKIKDFEEGHVVENNTSWNTESYMNYLERTQDTVYEYLTEKFGYEKQQVEKVALKKRYWCGECEYYSNSMKVYLVLKEGQLKVYSFCSFHGLPQVPDFINFYQLKTEINGSTRNPRDEEMFIEDDAAVTEHPKVQAAMTETKRRGRPPGSQSKEVVRAVINRKRGK